VVSVLFVCLSLTPSLLPRTWISQGVISGISGSIGYGLGVALAWLARTVAKDRFRMPRRARRALHWTVGVAASGLLVLALYYGSVWQRSLYALIGEPPPARLGYVRVLVLTVLIMAATTAVVRGIRAVARWIAGLARRVVSGPPASIAAVTVLALIFLVGGDAVLRDGFLPVASSLSAASNRATPSDAARPNSPTRSGSLQSQVSWESLGREGRAFVAGGPTLEQLRSFAGAQAKEPIRVYAGLGSAPTIAAESDLAVDELRRTDAASRAILCVVTATGTGWVDPYAAATLEYLAGGDTAIVATQFSYLPSWISFVSERERAAEAGRALFERVYAYWSALPAGHRPRLVLFAESLGSLGSEATFADLNDVRARTDGALWIGPTNANPLWSEVVANRSPGTPETLPVYRDGEVVRFASRPADLAGPPGPWHSPRVVYLQNPSDPVTWWSPGLLFSRPDWLNEPRGYDVQPAMRWLPLVTFFQVTADLALAQRAPSTHGHFFHGATVAGWVAVLQPSGWTETRTAGLTQLLDQL
jgi:uncharacterized membrane protein